MTIHDDVRVHLLERLAVADPNEIRQLNEALRFLGQWRSMMLTNTILHHQGTVVMEGPFAGLDFLPSSAEGCHVPKLLGCYEQPLHPSIEAAIARNYATILNIGCAEGYYAVGMARRMPAARVAAYDLDANARTVCVGLAAKNHVADRVEIEARFTAADFAAFASRDTLLLCDIEGGEDALLDPAIAPALGRIDMIVEAHEGMRRGITARLVDRFRATHAIRLIEDDGQRRLLNAPGWFKALINLDQLLATWEWRSGPTPWLVMTAGAAG